MWNILIGLRNSSTRCKIGATIVAMLAPIATHMGIDNAATIGKRNQIVEHLIKKESTQLRNPRGGLKLGGKISPLHRETPFRRKWHVMRDGDL